MATLFISDLHLDHSRPDLLDAFQRFLRERASNADALYILGDLFESWIGDDDDDALAETVRTDLKRLTEAGIPVYFVHGNRDFLVGDAFSQATGVTLLPEVCAVDLYGTPTLILHGDTLCTRDTDYQQFRLMARSPEWQAQMLSKSLMERRAFAAHLRQQSQMQGREKADDIMDVTPEEVTSQLQQYNVAKMIHGHTHRPNRHELTQPENGERIVLGDWDEFGWYLSVTPEQWTLEKFAVQGEA